MSWALSINSAMVIVQTFCVVGAQFKTLAISDLNRNPIPYIGQNVCVEGYLHFDRSLGIISESSDDPYNIPIRVEVFDFDYSIFLDRLTGDYTEYNPVRACGRVRAEPKCFVQNGYTCVPRNALLMEATVKRRNIENSEFPQ
jgi:hypothetical protein